MVVTQQFNVRVIALWDQLSMSCEHLHNSDNSLCRCPIRTSEIRHQVGFSL